jgi:hypothetical protein
MQSNAIYKLFIDATTLDEALKSLKKKLANNEYIVSTVVAENVATVTTAFTHKQVLKG